MANPICPRCKSVRTDRRRRNELLHRFLLHHFGFFPWVCNQCHHKFTFSERGKRKKRHSSDSAPEKQSSRTQNSEPASQGS